MPEVMKPSNDDDNDTYYYDGLNYHGREVCDTEKLLIIYFLCHHISLLLRSTVLLLYIVGINEGVCYDNGRSINAMK